MPTRFQERVYKYCKRIPRGNVSSYKAIARAMNTKAYRAVGTALNKNPYAPNIPCHRVINSDGRLGGFASGLKKKIELLKKEGVKIKNNKIEKKYIIKYLACYFLLALFNLFLKP